MLNLLQVTSGGGCGEFGRLHRADLDLGSVFPYCNRSRRDEKRRFIEIDSEGEGGHFKKSDISHTAGDWAWRPRFCWAFGITREGNMKRYEK